MELCLCCFQPRDGLKDADPLIPPMNNGRTEGLPVPSSEKVIREQFTEYEPDMKPVSSSDTQPLISQPGAGSVDEACLAGSAAPPPGAIKDVEAKLAEISSNRDPVMRKSDSNKNIAGFRDSLCEPTAPRLYPEVPKTPEPVRIVPVVLPPVDLAPHQQVPAAAPPQAESSSESEPGHVTHNDQSEDESEEYESPDESPDESEQEVPIEERVEEAAAETEVQVSREPESYVFVHEQTTSMPADSFLYKETVPELEVTQTKANELETPPLAFSTPLADLSGDTETTPTKAPGDTTRRQETPPEDITPQVEAPVSGVRAPEVEPVTEVVAPEESSILLLPQPMDESMSIISRSEVEQIEAAPVVQEEEDREEVAAPEQSEPTVEAAGEVTENLQSLAPESAEPVAESLPEPASDEQTISVETVKTSVEVPAEMPAEETETSAPPAAAVGTPTKPTEEPAPDTFVDEASEGMDDEMDAALGMIQAALDLTTEMREEFGETTKRREEEDDVRTVVTRREESGGRVGLLHESDTLLLEDKENVTTNTVQIVSEVSVKSTTESTIITTTE